MSEPHLFVCGGLSDSTVPRRMGQGANRHTLGIGSGRNAIRLNVEHLTTRLSSSLPDHLADLLEIAAYVYIADQTLTRGGTQAFDYGERWRRQIRLLIPVRCPERWNSSEVRGELESALGFLSDESWEFQFVRHPNPTQPERYLTDHVYLADGDEFDEVMLFSGGLDSLGGAVEEILAGQRRVALVSHRPVNNMYARQRELVEAISAKLPRRDLRPFHVAVTVNRGSAEASEYTQRTRSFLFASVAAIVAQLVGRDRIRFYENGVTSLNLPISGELVGSLASRTTHPQTLHRFAGLFSALFERPFVIQNPFEFLTKAEVLQRIHSLGHAKLCAQTSSCVHTRELKEGYTHCGRCTQCVDRRLAALTAGLTDADDPVSGYRSDVILGERLGPELTLVERYTGFAGDFERLTTPAEFAARFPEVNRALRSNDGNAVERLSHIYRLYQRHAGALRETLQTLVTNYSAQIVRQSFPPNSLLGVVLGRVDLPSSERTDLRVDPSVAVKHTLHLDSQTFAVVQGPRRCELGNTKEFHLFRVLWERRTKGYLSVEELIRIVWDDPHTEKNTVQRTVSNLRRNLRREGFTQIVLDGQQRNHYRLVVNPEPVAP